jgi:hypothetical protein
MGYELQLFASENLVVSSGLLELQALEILKQCLNKN